MIQWQIVYDLVVNNIVSVNQERVVQCNVFVWVFDIVSFLNFMFYVGDYCVFYWVNVVFIDRGVMLCVVNEFRVERNVDYFNVVFLEFFIMFIKGDQFRWVNKSEVYWLEEQNGCFIIGVLFEVEFINNFIVIQYCCSGEIWGLMSNQYYNNFFVILRVLECNVGSIGRVK